jgi:small conductance mechanosensitive channel
MSQIPKTDVGTVQELLASITQRWPDLLFAILVFAAFYFGAVLTSRAVHRLVQHVTTDKTAATIFGRLTYWGIFAIGLVTALSVSGFPVATLLTGLGLIGAALALALRDIIANIASGLFLLVKRPFRIGDVIVVGDHEGAVTNLTVRSTVLEAADGRMVFLPNSTVLTSVVTNSSAVSRRRVVVEVDVSRAGDPFGAAHIMAGALAGITGASDDPPAEDPAVAMTADSVRLSGRVWVDTSAVSFVAARSAAIEAVHRALSDAGVELIAPVEAS